MTIVQAIRNLTEGNSSAIVSAVGRRYTTAELQPKMIGEQACVFNRAGMTETERKGAWRVVPQMERE
ncbi:hypothetical protein PZE06_23820 [Robertmurraya sp. DFI.2.37]|uniref:hypothetical protein n=1 Tax=Robertmurraya sp. DFI.2.37 TaxID=3031819 RepID=UPI0023DC9A3A|nr:hypothetical protein [Robertmurraya sp. DFI.2.37]MDF1511163.1 hypothetical protein [Robertmurraya sp. DFI.2.37]